MDYFKRMVMHDSKEPQSYHLTHEKQHPCPSLSSSSLAASATEDDDFKKSISAAHGGDSRANKRPLHHEEQSTGRWAHRNHDNELTNNQSSKYKKRSDENENVKERKVRLVLCIYAVTGLILCQTSRMVLNLCIVEMVHMEQVSNDISDTDGSCPYVEEPTAINGEDRDGQQAHGLLDVFPTSGPMLMYEVNEANTATPLPVQVITDFKYEQPPSTSLSNAGNSMLRMSDDGPLLESGALKKILLELPAEPNEQAYNGNERAISHHTTEDQDLVTDYPRYEWSTRQQSLLLGAFFMGYFPFMLIGGFLAEKYGSKYIILFSVIGSSMVNLLTPWMADYSYYLLVFSRIFIGAAQAGTVPALYDLFSKWLTMTETSIFAPMIKVALAAGSLSGSVLCWVLLPNGFGWPIVFYLSGIICLVWSLIWWLISSSTPQESRFVDHIELARIMRKKGGVDGGGPPLSPMMVARPIGKTAEMGAIVRRFSCDSNDLKPHSSFQQSSPQSSGCCSECGRSQPMAMKINNGSVFINAGAATTNTTTKNNKESTPWRLILTSPSVLALILVKFTYNFCMDFAAVILPTYLKNVHHAPANITSIITALMAAIQTLFILLVGTIAKNMVRNQSFGWSKTTVRKVFQGGSNFIMALMYIFVIMSKCDLTLVAILFQVVSAAWMLGAGGETMMPYDLSEKYPATIMGIAHSVSNLSGLFITFLTGLILGDRGSDIERWNTLIYMVAGAGAFGGLVFVLVAKAKPIEGTNQASAS